MTMQKEDLNTWLKTASQNKITRKNAWKSTLIDHFNDVANFKDETGVNFERATFTLDGCTKTYTNRVDDVHDNTFKLLETISTENKTKKHRKKGDFLEKNLNHINLKERPSSEFYDPVFMSIFLKHNFNFLLCDLEASSEGIFLYNNDSHNIIMEDEKIEFEYKEELICPSLKNVKALDEIEIEEIENEPLIEINEPELEINDCELESEEEFIEEEKIAYESTPFEYFKGWAGPKWKTVYNVFKRKNDIKKPKEVFRIDFMDNYDFSVIKKSVNTTISHDCIIQRRSDRNLLPEDYRIQGRDLYKYNLINEYFRKLVSKEKTHENIELDPIIENIGDDLAEKLDQSIIFDDVQLKLTGTAKKVDMKRLKTNILKSIKKKSSSLSDIVNNIPSNYPEKEAKDISVHFCLISLLHLANETDISLESIENDVIIKN